MSKHGGCCHSSLLKQQQQQQQQQQETMSSFSSSPLEFLALIQDHHQQTEHEIQPNIVKSIQQQPQHQQQHVHSSVSLVPLPIQQKVSVVVRKRKRSGFSNQQTFRVLVGTVILLCVVGVAVVLVVNFGTKITTPTRTRTSNLTTSISLFLRCMYKSLWGSNLFLQTQTQQQNQQQQIAPFVSNRIRQRYLLFTTSEEDHHTNGGTVALPIMLRPQLLGASTTVIGNIGTNWDNQQQQSSQQSSSYSSLDPNTIQKQLTDTLRNHQTEIMTSSSSTTTSSPIIPTTTILHTTVTNPMNQSSSSSSSSSSFEDSKVLTVVIHIGPYKTGTTSIQRNLFLLHHPFYELDQFIVPGNWSYTSDEEKKNLKKFLIRKKKKKPLHVVPKINSISYSNCYSIVYYDLLVSKQQQQEQYDRDKKCDQSAVGDVQKIVQRHYDPIPINNDNNNFFNQQQPMQSSSTTKEQTQNLLLSTEYFSEPYVNATEILASFLPPSSSSQQQQPIPTRLSSSTQLSTTTTNIMMKHTKTHIIVVAYYRRFYDWIQSYWTQMNKLKKYEDRISFVTYLEELFNTNYVPISYYIYDNTKTTTTTMSPSTDTAGPAGDRHKNRFLDTNATIMKPLYRPKQRRLGPLYPPEHLLHKLYYVGPYFHGAVQKWIRAAFNVTIFDNERVQEMNPDPATSTTTTSSGSTSTTSTSRNWEYGEGLTKHTIIRNHHRPDLNTNHTTVFEIKLYNMYALPGSQNNHTNQTTTMTTNFYCHAIPNAPNTCKEIQQLEQQDSTNVRYDNVSPILVYEALLYEAIILFHLIERPDATISDYVYSNIFYFNILVSKVRDYQEQTLQLTQHDFPYKTCVNETIQNWIYERTVETEQQYFPHYYYKNNNDDNDNDTNQRNEQSPEDFRTKYDKNNEKANQYRQDIQNQLCTVNVTAVLINSPVWQEFFLHLN